MAIHSLHICAAAKAKDFRPNFNFMSGSAKMLLLLLVNFSYFDLWKYPLNGSHIFSCMQLKTNLHTLFFICFQMLGLRKSAFGGHFHFMITMILLAIWAVGLTSVSKMMYSMAPISRKYNKMEGLAIC